MESVLTISVGKEKRKKMLERTDESRMSPLKLNSAGQFFLITKRANSIPFLHCSMNSLSVDCNGYCWKGLSDQNAEPFISLTNDGQRLHEISS